jgi:hypothetical protein
MAEALADFEGRGGRNENAQDRPGFHVGSLAHFDSLEIVFPLWNWDPPAAPIRVNTALDVA